MIDCKKNINLIDPSWRQFFLSELEKPYFQALNEFLDLEKESLFPIYPPSEQIFSAFQQTPLDRVKVVIVGQDPYHGPGQAHGLSFSVNKETRIPPSLKNIFKELNRDLQIPIPAHGSLMNWAKQGVLLLNATLTVRGNQPKSHFGKGWEIFTDEVINLLSSQEKPIVFILWGRSAFHKFEQIQCKKNSTLHLILTAPHPSPFSAHSGFLGCSHFSKTNLFLKNLGLTPIDWKIF